MLVTNYRQQFWQGARDLLPLASGVIPFGLIAGANGVALGLNPETIMGMTVLLYAGSAQLVAYQLIQENAALVIIVLISMVINLRFAIYSAAFSPLISPLRTSYRLPLAYLLSDQSYGLCFRPEQLQKSASERLWYYSGTAVTQWLFWVFSVLAGVAVGMDIPPHWSLEFTIPLAFLAMLTAIISSRLLLIVAIISGSCAVLFQLLPYNSGFIFAVTAGVAGGVWLPQLLRNPGVSQGRNRG